MMKFGVHTESIFVFRFSSSTLDNPTSDSRVFLKRRTILRPLMVVVLHIPQVFELKTELLVR
jgi:hypothetical protein